MQQLIKIVLVFIRISLVRPNAKAIDGIFEGRLFRARNMAMASNIADAINRQYFHEPKDRNIKRSHVFVSPREIHLSLAPDGLSYIVTWSTLDSTKNLNGSFVEYGSNPKNLTQRSEATETKFVAYGPKNLTQYFHRALIGPSLTQDTAYFYRVGSKVTLSDLFFCTSFNNGSDWSPHIAIYGDMGNVNAQSIPRLQRETQSGFYDMIIHVGDFAYNMATDNGRVGNEFMKQIEPIASYIPYMTCVGNHEYYEDFNMSSYKAHFSMPEDRSGDHVTSDMFFSFNVGPIHFISISTEYLYDPTKDEKWAKLQGQGAMIQYQWLVKELENATSAQQRSLHPWIIIYGHRPMYCSSSDDSDHMCDENVNPIKNGFPKLGIPGLEHLLWKYNVDIAIWAHEHNYERFWPLYDGKVLNGSYEEPYRDPKAPIHITTGSAGCQERIDPFTNITKPYDAFRSTDYGYTRLKAYNSSHLRISQVSDDQDGKIIDEIWVIKSLPRKSYDDLNKM